MEKYRVCEFRGKFTVEVYHELTMKWLRCNELGYSNDELNYPMVSNLPEYEKLSDAMMVIDWFINPEKYEPKYHYLNKTT